MSEHHWIKSAIKHTGVFKAAAKRAGMGTEAFARKHEHAKGVLGHRARLALTLHHLSNHDAETPKDEIRKTVEETMENNK